MFCICWLPILNELIVLPLGNLEVSPILSLTLPQSSPLLSLKMSILFATGIQNTIDVTLNKISISYSQTIFTFIASRILPIYRIINNCIRTMRFFSASIPRRSKSGLPGLGHTYNVLQVNLISFCKTRFRYF